MSLNTTDRQIDRPAVRVALFNNVNIRILVQNIKYKHEHESDMADILTGIGIHGHFRPDSSAGLDSSGDTSCEVDQSGSFFLLLNSLVCFVQRSIDRASLRNSHR